MSTPVLTKKQQKHTLSAKKTPVKGLRNVLAQPQDGYWPIVTTNKRPQLEDVIRKLIPAMKRPSLKIPWSQLMHMKKEERSQAKKEALLKEEKVPDKNIVNSVVMGINAVTRSLEKNNLCCVLLDADVEPPLLIKHVILMAQNKKIPILLLPSLKSIILNSLGYASAGFALKNIVMESVDHHFHPLYTNIYTIFKEIPLPKNSLELFKDTEVIEESTLCEDNENSAKNEMKASSLLPEKFTLSSDVYKYRSSCKERTFVPPNARNKPVIEKMECDEFISISNYAWDDENTVNVPKNTRYMSIHNDTSTKNTAQKDTDSNLAETRNTPKQTNNKADEMKLKNKFKTYGNEVPTVKYLPLKVKRLQGNANRVKATKVSKQKKK